MHELTQKISHQGFMKNTQVEVVDDIISAWLEEKCKSYYEESEDTELEEKINIQCRKQLLSHFGLSKKSCGCGGVEWNDEKKWWQVNGSGKREWNYAPCCGEKLEFL